jgi:hypothetical protein
MYWNSSLNYIFKKITIKKMQFYADGRLAIGHLKRKSVGNNCGACGKRIL